MLQARPFSGVAALDTTMFSIARSCRSRSLRLSQRVLSSFDRMTIDGRVHSKEEVLISLQVSSNGKVEPVTHMRSTLVAASLLSLKSLGHLDAYLRNLPAALHDTILHSVAGMWLPLEIGVAHYRAADALDLSVEEQIAVGHAVADRIQKSLLGTLVRVAKSAGVTPWTGLEYSPRLWGRVLQGGSLALYRLGPKEARVECHGAPELARLPYFRNGFRGMFLGSGQLFCEKLYARDLASFVARGVVAFQVAWV